jgi:hypothetical protein
MSALRPGLFIPEERAHRIGGCVYIRTGLNSVERRKVLFLPGLEPRPLGRTGAASLYTDCAMMARFLVCIDRNLKSHTSESPTNQ